MQCGPEVCIKLVIAVLVAVRDEIWFWACTTSLVCWMCVSDLTSRYLFICAACFNMIRRYSQALMGGGQAGVAAAGIAKLKKDMTGIEGHLTILMMHMMSNVKLLRAMMRKMQ